MREDQVKLGGMALQNGVLVHGPTSWACAVRTPDGSLEVVAQRKRLRAASVEQPLLRGPARLLDAMLLLPTVRRRVPQARLPFEQPMVLGTMLAGLVGMRLLRGAGRVSPAVEELAGAILSLVPPTLALRGGELAAYHGAEHISIGTYEHGEPRPREHERCGTHLVGPLLVSSVAGAVIAARAPARLRGPARLAATVGAVAAATEIFGWMVRNPGKPLARALARPGYELQHRYATAEPTREQLEVAEAALAACLELEHGR